MVKRFKLVVMVLVLITVSNPCKAGNPYDDVKHFVQTNHYYRHGLTVATGICSYLFFNSFLHKNKGDLNHNVNHAVSLGGACVVSKIAQENPGYTTLAALALVAYSLLK